MVQTNPILSWILALQKQPVGLTRLQSVPVVLAKFAKPFAVALLPLI